MILSPFYDLVPPLWTRPFSAGRYSTGEGCIAADEERIGCSCSKAASISASVLAFKTASFPPPAKATAASGRNQ
jgi:hypothetical protein